MFDLLIEGGTVVDPSQGIHERLDVAVAAGRIAKAAPSIERAEAARVIDASGKIVAPGLIDIHTHVFNSGHNEKHPDIAGVQAGVTTIVDAGGAGPGNFDEFQEAVLRQARTTVYLFLSVFHDRALAYTAPPDTWDMDPEGVARIAAEHPDLMIGVKVILSPRMVEAHGLRHLEASTKAARDAGVKLMLHIGDIGPKGQTPTPAEVTSRALAMLELGDIVTHIFTPLTGGALDQDGKVLSALVEAQQRGVVMDPSYGDFNFGWERADAVLSQGLRPDVIGTDLEIQPSFGMRTALTRGLLEYTAYFLALGFSLDEVVRMTTVNAAKALGIEERAGSLAVGRDADLSVLELVEGRWSLEDVAGQTRTGARALVPFVTVKGGDVVEPGSAPHEWGWTPPPANGGTPG